MATGGNTYQWQPDDHLNDAGIPNPIAFPDITTAYTIAITDVYGCHASKSILITVDDLPLFQISPSEPSICLGSSVGLSASGALTYQWSPKQDLTFSSGSLVIAAPQKSITYMVTGIDQYGCSDSTSVKINVIDCILDIPNVFTPNGDGKNDFFKVIYVGVTDYNIQIFSRWGSKLFESSKVEDPWDGKSHGIDISEGTYFYLITIGDKHYSGSIALIR